jgi:hypothetical protein
MTSCSYCVNLAGRGGKPKCLKGHPLGANPMFVGEIRIDSLNVFRWTPEKCLDRAVRQAYRPTRFEKILYDPVL